MAHQPYQYLRLLLRNNLLLDLDEFDLVGTGQQGLVCNFLGMHLASAFQPRLRTGLLPKSLIPKTANQCRFYYFLSW